MDSIISIPGFDEPFSSLSHLLMAGVFLVLGWILVKKGRGNGGRVFSLVLFSFAAIFLFSMSGVFHLLEKGTTGALVLQRLDHAAIWFMIAASFTPVHVILFRGIWRWGFLLLIWTIAITGLVLKTVFFSSIPEWASLSMFLGLGWMGALSAWKVIHVYKDRSIRFLLLSAMAYTIGAILEFLRWPVIIDGVFGPHEIFHIGVMLGALFHWQWVYSWANCPVVTKLVFNVTEHAGSHFEARANGEAILVKAETLPELKSKLLERVSQLFHHQMPAESINLKYSREERL